MTAATSSSGEVDVTGADSTSGVNEDIAPSLLSTLLCWLQPREQCLFAQLLVDSIQDVCRAVSVMRPNYRVVFPANAGS